MITRETVEDFFDHTRRLRDEGRAQFNIDSMCRWSFFFVDSNKEKLIHVGMYLEDSGYEVIGFLEPAPDDEDQETIYLRADRVEQHTVDSIMERNSELCAVAEEFLPQEPSAP